MSLNDCYVKFKVLHFIGNLFVGTNGGISWVGLLVSILGGITVGLSYYLTVLITVDTVILQLAVPQWPIIIIGGIGGLFGSVIDSFLGAMLQYSGKMSILYCYLEYKCNLQSN